MSKKYILLTGASGFLGSKILRKFVDEGHNVLALLREKSIKTRINDINGQFEFFLIDEEFNNLNMLFETYDIETIIHTATEYGRNSKASDTFKTNLIFPIRLIEFGLQNSLKYFFNSDTFFGKPELQGATYMNEYTTSKKYFLDYLISNSNRFKTVNLRLEHVFGEFDSDTKFVTNILHKLLKSEKEILLTNGLQKRDFVYVEDVVSAYYKVFTNIDIINNLSEFQIGRGESISVRHFVQLMANETKSKSKLVFGAVSNNKSEIQNSVADIRALEDIGWQANYDLRTAIIKMIEMETIKYNFGIC
jgi:nucleoside-diphosphate-sugar epimerase